MSSPARAPASSPKAKGNRSPKLSPDLIEILSMLSALEHQFAEAGAAA